MKPYPIPTHRLHEIVRAPKCVQSGLSLDYQQRGTKGKKLDARLELKDDVFVDMRFFVHCGDHECPTTYESGLCVGGPRVRGIGYSPVRRMRKYKEYIPKGWHENVIDPNLPDTDDNANRHIPLPHFSPTDLQDFTRQSADKWQIDLDYAESLL